MNEKTRFPIWKLDSSENSKCNSEKDAGESCSMLASLDCSQIEQFVQILLKTVLPANDFFFGYDTKIISKKGKIKVRLHQTKSFFTRKKTLKI